MPTIEALSTAGRPRAALAALFAGASLAACVTPKPAPPPPPPPAIVVIPPVTCDPPAEPRDLAARHLVATQDRLSTLNTADLGLEATRGSDGDGIEQQVDQALALSMTHGAGDLARAQAVLDQVLRNNTPQADPWRPLARLLAYRLGEQRRAEDAVERAAQQLRDTQRENQRRLDDVNNKLEALKAIERNLNTRSPGSSPKP